MHISRRRFVIALLALLALAGLAAAAPPAYTLRLHQGKGDKATYAVTVTETDTMSGAGAPKEKIVSTAGLTWAAAFQGTSPDGTIRVQSTVTGGPLQAKMGTQRKSRRVSDSVANYTLSPRGEVKETKLLSGSPPQVSAVGTVLTVDDVFAPALLPEKPVKVGDAWESTLDIPAPTGEPGDVRHVKQQSKVLGQVSYAGRPCLKIQTTLRQSQEGTQESPDGSGRMTVTAQGESTAIWLFDPKQGLVMKTDSNGGGTMTRVVEAAGGGRQTAEVKQTVGVHSRMTAYNGKKLAAQ